MAVTSKACDMANGLHRLSVRQIAQYCRDAANLFGEGMTTEEETTFRNAAYSLEKILKFQSEE